MISLLRLRRLTALFALALLVAAPSSATAQEASPAKYKVVTERNVMVPMTDGTLLAIDIYRPDAPGKFPALVERTPYDKTKSSEIQVSAHTFFAERGYIFLVQDTRGRFKSEGTFIHHQPHVKGVPGESTDTYDTIDWLLKNVPNNNGRVGQWGISLAGWHAAMGMIDAHPALKAFEAQIGESLSAAAVKDEPDPPPVRGKVCDRTTVEQDIAGVRVFESGERAQHRRLPAARRPEQRDEFARRDGEREVAHGRHTPAAVHRVGLREREDLERLRRKGIHAVLLIRSRQSPPVNRGTP